jgi:hypothetical protein
MKAFKAASWAVAPNADLLPPQVIFAGKAWPPLLPPLELLSGGCLFLMPVIRTITKRCVVVGRTFMAALERDNRWLYSRPYLANLLNVFRRAT